MSGIRYVICNLLVLHYVGYLIYEINLIIYVIFTFRLPLPSSYTHLKVTQSPIFTDKV